MKRVLISVEMLDELRDAVLVVEHALPLIFFLGKFVGEGDREALIEVSKFSQAADEDVGMIDDVFENLMIGKVFRHRARCRRPFR